MAAELQVIEARQGMIVSDATVSPSTVADSFVAQLVQLNSGAETVAGAEVTLDICTACARCRVEALLQKIDRRSGKVLEEAPAALKAGEVGFCRLSPLQPVRRPDGCAFPAALGARLAAQPYSAPCPEALDHCLCQLHNHRPRYSVSCPGIQLMGAPVQG